MENDVVTISPKTYKRKNMQPPVTASADEVSVLLSLAKTSLRQKACKYPDTETGLRDFMEKTESYFDYLDAVNMNAEDGKAILFPDIESWACYCGISRMTLLSYGNRESDFGDFVVRTKDVIGGIKKTLGLRNKISTVLTVFDMCNNHSYANTNQFTINSNTAAEEKTVSILPEADDMLGIL
ncbi:MAG: hypothetical protein Q4A04_08275 [Eubacteriales bacterium]|nr:hypothetical protein [Eubacteriales bacterium]